MTKIYSAQFEFYVVGRYVQNSKIIYLAKNDSEALRACLRFWENRHQAIPDYWNELLCVKVYPQTIGEISPSGAYQTQVGFPFFEYKCDTAGRSLEEHIEAAIAKWEKDR